MNKEKIQKQLEKVLEMEHESHLRRLHEVLYEELFDMIYAIAKNRFPTDPEDVVHDFFVAKLFKVSPQKWQQVQGFLEPFIVRSLLNFCYTLSARKKRQANALKNDQNPYVVNESSTTRNPATLLHNEIDLEEALKAISSRQRIAFLLHYKSGYKYKEFAEVMEPGLSAGAAKQLVNRAKSNMQTWLNYS